MGGQLAGNHMFFSKRWCQHKKHKGESSTPTIQVTEEKEVRKDDDVEHIPLRKCNI